MQPKFCVFGFSNDIDAIAAAGYDCIEMHMHEVMSMEVMEFKETCQKLNDSSITCEVIDNPVPLDQVIADASFDLDYYKGYLEVGTERAAELGVKYFNYGNGRTRSIPTSGDIEAAREKNLRFMRMMADIAGEKGITILIEPLAPQVSNVVLSIPEAIAYAHEIGRPNIGTFLDYRWFIALNHPYSMIEEYAEHIQHIHIDNPEDPFPTRKVPRYNDYHDYSQFFDALKKINYEKIISIEASTFDNYEEDLRAGLAFLRAMI